MHIWFLLVIADALAGITLVFSRSAGGDISGVPAFLSNKAFRLTLGVLAVAVGLVKLIFAPMPPIPVIGDLLPALAALASGVSLLAEYYDTAVSTGRELPPVIRRVCIEERRYVGIVTVILGVLHFVFPRAVFL